MKLFTTSNPKIAKGEAHGFLTNIMHLAPAWLSGFNVCPMATKGCAAACLNTAGRGGIFKTGVTTNQIQEARRARTLFFFNARPAFMAQLVKEIRNAIRNAERHGLTPVFRLNGTSDIRWETVTIEDADGFVWPNVMTMFPDVVFYDYTKIPNRRDLPANYHLTFSLAEDNDEHARSALDNGMNVAVVFRKHIPGIFMERPVVNGDATDLRFLDGSGVIVGLKAKGKARHDTSGFVRD